MNKFFTVLGWLLLVFGSGSLAWAETMDSSPPTKEAGSSEGDISPLPGPILMARYDALSRKSPFTAVTVEETASFAQDLLLAGYVRLKGEDFVMVASRSTPSRFLVGKKESPSSHGLVLIEVLRDAKGDPTKMKAKIKKAGEVATLSYEVAAAPAAPPQPPLPGQPVPGPGVAGQVTPPQLPPGAGRPGSPAVIRRRVIPIPPAPAR